MSNAASSFVCDCTQLHSIEDKIELVSDRGCHKTVVERELISDPSITHRSPRREEQFLIHDVIELCSPVFLGGFFGAGHKISRAVQAFIVGLAVLSVPVVPDTLNNGIRKNVRNNYHSFVFM